MTNKSPRQDAIAKGLPKYFSGKACKHGHVTDRWVSGGCVECCRIRAASSAGAAARRKSYRKHAYKHREKINARRRRRYKSNPEAARRYARQWYRKKHNIPEPTRQRPDECECCETPTHLLRTMQLVLDHCHETNIFRGWLCSPCNRAIGALGDNVQGLERAVAYLKRARR